MNTFKMTGTLGLPKETEKFKPYSERTSDSGWQMNKLRVNATCGDNRHMLSIDAGYWKDEHGDIYVFTKGGVDDNGNKIKGETIKIPFKDRLTDPRLSEVAEFRKFVVDTEVRGRRYALQNALDKIKEGKEITAEELAAMGVESESEISVEFEKSKKKRKEFISEKDFIDHIKKVVESGKYKDKLFDISGNIVSELNRQNGQFYTKYVPNRIYLAASDAEPMCEADIKLYYGKDGLDTLSVEEKGKYYLNGYVFEYNSETKKNDLPVPVTLVLDKENPGREKWDKIVSKFLKYFTVDGDEFKEMGLKVKMLNGAQKEELKIEDLDEETQENIELGLITIEDVKKELGISNVYGDRIQEYRIDGLMNGYSKGAVDTTYVEDDFTIKVAETDEEVDAILDGMDDEDDI